jgi:luciferase family oxidoreductase group 1
MPNNVPKFMLGALDLSPIFPGTSATDALRSTLELAPQLEGFGYGRYWLAEHHKEWAAHSCPELLVAMLAERTTRMRIGTAGILLQLHNPLLMAKRFRLLQAVYPDRIDLGIARGRASAVVETLMSDAALKQRTFEQGVCELIGYLRGMQTIVNPNGVGSPEIWMLGRSTISMELAARHGTAFSFAAYLAEPGLDEAMVLERYRTTFQPAGELAEPKCSIAVAGVCARTDAEARTLLNNDSPIGVFRPTLVGGPETCAREISALYAKTGVTEFVFLDMCRVFSDRRDSYRLLASALL